MNFVHSSGYTSYEAFDFFYINPPYGSKNNGLSCILWLHRCMDLISARSEGCIIIPNDSDYSWSIRNTNTIISFLNNNGFSVIRNVPNIHQYHLLDNPNLKSSMLIVKRIKEMQSIYRGKQLPASECRNLYGRPRPIPQFIQVDKDNPNGICNFDWEYGDLAYLINNTNKEDGII